ncbi:MAG: hypothetical protein GY770_09880, partial [Aestuariibacter sp.]|nr:hypothetical protein [Aestuariibacter sp.]
RGANLAGADFSEATLRLTNLLGIVLDPISEERRRQAQEKIKEAIPGYLWQYHEERVLSRLDAAINGGKPIGLSAANSVGAAFQMEKLFDGEHKSLSRKEYEDQLVPFLVEVACTNRYVAHGIATYRANLYAALAGAMLEQECESTRTLSPKILEDLSETVERGWNPFDLFGPRSF